MTRLSMLAIAILAAAGFAGSAQALDQKPVLTLELAQKMADACEAAQKAGGWRPINVAIYDDGGNLKVFRRQDNAFLGSIQVAQMKGHTSAVFPFSTRTFAELSFGKDGQPAPIPGLAFIPGVTAFAGGLPVMTAAGQQIGSIGVSGASSDEDEQCAQAGIDAIADMLK